MELKKCERCGCFFTSENTICSKCAPKDKCEISTLKNYIIENGNEIPAIENIVTQTGFTEKNISRYLSSDEFNNINIQL